MKTLIKRPILTKKVGFPFVILPTLDQKKILLEHDRRVLLLINEASRRLHGMCEKDDNLFDELSKCPSTVRITLANRTIRDNVPQFEEFRKSLGYSLRIYDRIAASMASKMIVGFSKRNGKGKNKKLPNHPPQTKNYKSLHLIDGMAKIIRNDKKEDLEFNNEPTKRGLIKCSNAKICIPTHVGKIEFEFAVPKKYVNLATKYRKNNDNIYGNLRIHKKFIKGAVEPTLSQMTLFVFLDEPFRPAYQPVKAIGIDFNKRRSSFVTVSEPFLYNNEMTNFIDLCEDTKKGKKIDLGDYTDIDELVEKHGQNTVINNVLTRIQEIDIKINDNKLTSRVRRPLRQEWEMLHTILHNLFSKHSLEELLRFVWHEKALLCVDDISVSNETTGFGQYQYKDEIISMCRKHSIPYVLVPTYHTSSDCANCYDKTDKHYPIGRNTKIDKVSCNNCQTICDDDINAAQNIRNDGILIWNQVKRYRPNASQRKKDIVYIEYNTDLSTSERKCPTDNNEQNNT